MARRLGAVVSPISGEGSGADQPGSSLSDTPESIALLAPEKQALYRRLRAEYEEKRRKQALRRKELELKRVRGRGGGVTGEPSILPPRRDSSVVKVLGSQTWDHLRVTVGHRCEY